jgi:hypothetical protein
MNDATPAAPTSEPSPIPAAPAVPTPGGAQIPPDPATTPPPESLASHEQAHPNKRAAKQAARDTDVPRIRELTAKLRAAERERDQALGRTPAAEPTAPATAGPQTNSPATTAPPRTAPVAPAPAGPSGLWAVPEEKDDPRPTDAEEYAEIVRWEARQQMREANRRHTETQQQQRQREVQQQIAVGWHQQVTAAMTKYPDFQAKAKIAEAYIPEGSVMDGWILSQPGGADLMYHLATHLDELQTIKGMGPFEAARTLTLLQQRLTPDGESAQTGSAPAPPTLRAPRPPNPVRTGPMSTGDEPPGADASVADHERYFYKSRRR